MCLTRNSRLINGWENSGRCFCCFCKTARSTSRASFVAVTFTSRSVQHGRASKQVRTLESAIRGRHIYKQICSTWQSVKASTLESTIRGCHIYKQIRRLLVREILTLEREEGNNHNKFAVSLLKDTTVLGHGPREFLQVFWHFLRHGETITCEVTNRRKRGKATSQY